MYMDKKDKGVMARISVIALFFVISATSTFANEKEGSPFHTNFTADRYGAHERNFDVVCDKWGNVYFANFQGILHYSNSSWELFTTSDISRVTELYMADDGTVYAGGYNTLGKLSPNQSGKLEYHDIKVSSPYDEVKVGEILKIFDVGGALAFVSEGSISFVVRDTVVNRVVVKGNTVLSAFMVGGKLLYQTDDGAVYVCHRDGTIVLERDLVSGIQINSALPYRGSAYLMGTNEGLWLYNEDNGRLSKVANPDISGVSAISNVIGLEDGSFALSCADGLYHLDGNLKTLSHFNEENGLCCNVINSIAADGSGSIWCAGIRGVAAVSWPSFFSRFGEGEGLLGESLCMAEHKGELYVGTYQGVFFYDSGLSRFRKLEDVGLACWNLYVDNRGDLLALSSSGLYRISGDKAKCLSDNFHMSIIQLGDGSFLSGEVDGIYHITSFSPLKKKKVADVKQVDKIEKGFGLFWLHNAFGEIFSFDLESGVVTQIDREQGLEYRQGNKLFAYKDGIYIVGRQGFIEYAGGSFIQSTLIGDFAYVDAAWWPGLVQNVGVGDYFVVTSGDGKDIAVYTSDGYFSREWTGKITALKTLPIRCVFPGKDGVFWIGGRFGLIKIDFSSSDTHYESQPLVFLRDIKVNDSIVWNGFFTDTSFYSLPQLPFTPKLPAKMRNLTFDFGTLSTDSYSSTLYSYMMEGYDDDWSVRNPNPYCEYKMLPYRKYTLKIKTFNSFGVESPVRSFSFSISKPFYLRWYSILFYVLLWAYLMYLFFKWRTAKMIREKEHLEHVVEERTSEVRQQRDEIHEKSQQLEKTLGDLEKAQSDLVRQEKMAMVGKLTKGLVDRILNPINYINNFSLLTAGFAKDLRENMQEAKGSVPEDVYEDSMDLFDLMKTNLGKISQHGMSVSRILKSMEEMLRERKNVFTKLDICEQCRVSLEVAGNQNTAIKEKYGCKFEFVSEQESVVIDAIGDLLKKALNSLILNSIYALEKKAEKERYSPLLRITVKKEGEGNVSISVYDNGIGIESSILPMLFDPYFTTKPTAEAVGIGLYLTKDVVQSHNGTIEVKSEKNVYSDFLITLPINHSNG